MDPIADLRRRLDNMIRPGTIHVVDHEQARCRVKSGALLTQWLPWFSRHAGSVRDWSPPTVGEQCVIISPSGELAAGFVLVGLNSGSFPAPSSNQVLDSRTYADGTWMGYDMGRKEMTVIMTAGGKQILQIPAGIEIQGDVTITGTVTVSEDVIAGGISLVEHVHGGVQGGSSTTGAPQ